MSIPILIQTYGGVPVAADATFGVITEFVYRIHPQCKTVYGGVLTFTLDALDTLVPATTAWWKKGPRGKEGMMQLMTVGPDRRVCEFDMIYFLNNYPCIVIHTELNVLKWI